MGNFFPNCGMCVTGGTKVCRHSPAASTVLRRVQSTTEVGHRPPGFQQRRLNFGSGLSSAPTRTSSSSSAPPHSHFTHSWSELRSLAWYMTAFKCISILWLSKALCPAYTAFIFIGLPFCLMLGIKMYLHAFLFHENLWNASSQLIALSRKDLTNWIDMGYGTRHGSCLELIDVLLV